MILNTKKALYTIAIVSAFLSCDSNTNARQVEYDEDGKVSKNGQFYDAQEEETGVVYICTGKKSHAYHSNPECYGIKSCRANIEKIPIEEAEDMGRTPCHYCHQ